MQGTVLQKEPLIAVTPHQKPDNIYKLYKFLVRISLVNLFIVACLGVALRSFPLLDAFPLQYKNLLHGHSHFAFGGWVMPVLLALILKYFPAIAILVKFKHWKNIAALFIVSAYGMLFSFPVQGYKAVSISFSTLSIFAGFYMVIVIWKALGKNTLPVSSKFLKAGLFYLAISAIGPFATAPIIAMGEAGTPIYYNAIYYYLHFQYNGWFTFAILAILYKMLENRGVSMNAEKVFILMNLSVIPSFFLSVLWNQPSVIYNVVGGIAAIIQVAALIYFLKDIRGLKWKWNGRVTDKIFLLAISAFILKIFLQLISAIPSIAVLAYQQRNITIAYLHLVLLGFVSLFSFAAIAKDYLLVKHLKTAIVLFLFSFIITQGLIIGFAGSNIYGFTIPNYSSLLVFFSCLFPVSILFLIKALYPYLKNSRLF